MNRPFALPIFLPRGPQHYWNVMREHATAWTVADIAGCTNGVSFKTVKTYVAFLVKSGAVKAVGSRKGKAGQFDATTYRVAIKDRDAPVVRRDTFEGSRGRSQLQVWTAMRTLGVFTLPELAVAASTEDHVVKLRTAETYVRRLAAAGVVLVVEPYRRGGNGHARGARAGTYRLARLHNTGPKPPKIFGVDTVFDANREKIIAVTDVREVAA